MGMPSLFAGGAAVGDVDADGDLDLFIVRGDTAPNLLMLNDGSGRFTRSTANPGLDSPGGGANVKLSGPVFADMDGDGDLDLFVGGLNGEGSRLFAGDGVGGFTDVTAGSGFDSMTSDNTISSSFGDYDGDGDLDLAMAHWGTARLASAPGETETLWRNDSAGGVIRFTAVSAAAGISAELGLNVDGKIGRDRDYSFAPNFADIDDDGDLDLLIVADFNSSRVFRNNGDGTFTNMTDPTQITDTNGMGTDIGDFDNDGRPDWFVSSINSNRLYRNMSGSLIDTPSAGVDTGSWGWGSCFADFDLDGHLDIYQTNGWISDTGASPQEPYTADRSRLWMNDGSQIFSDAASASNIVDTVQGRAVICADFDDDLDTDILLLVNGSPDGAIYWDNQITSRRAISVRLNGPPSNRTGIGARLTIETAGTTQTRWVRAGTTFTAQTAPTHVIGMGDDAQIGRLIVDWPDGRQSVITSASAGARIVVDHPG
ncbi:RNA-binding protein [Algimonas porphyrae]|uniref:RNA-binding protein n=2 Tax=Algimonas porphyrae TaxID=1128113 RepID=A0ABQ5V5B2_9PROT|nr:RNA-binding protein [Algimonas porphyrae]